MTVVFPVLVTRSLDVSKRQLLNDKSEHICPRQNYFLGAELRNIFLFFNNEF